ncbi:MAG: aminotransferase class III-fold pyridoxal phosphate-dependent enzyme [Gammaproteobacteria bacterium]|nr:aminotransferase class III-fold pyridoxal phosphate-dependent enzyme [Gammaproteobacteria bacterium]
MLTFEGPRNVAALLIEPVVGTNGVVVYPDGYLEGVRRITEQHGIVLIFDEVMTGFGRLGETFAANRFGVVPDMITFAKGVASAFHPARRRAGPRGAGAALRRPPADVRPHTYAGHPLAMAAGLATVTTMRKEGAVPAGPRARTVAEGRPSRRSRLGTP